MLENIFWAHTMGKVLGWVLCPQQLILPWYNFMSGHYSYYGLPGWHSVKDLPAMWVTQVQTWVGEDPLEKGMATHSSILVWRIPWTEEPGRLYSPWGYKESNTTERLTHAYVILIMGFPGRAVVKNLPANAADKRDWGSNLWVRKVPWRRK